MDFLDIHIWSWTLFRIFFLSAVHTPGSIIHKEDFMNRIHLYSNNNSATTTSAASATASGVRLEPVATVLLDNTTFFLPEVDLCASDYSNNVQKFVAWRQFSQASRYML